MQKAELKKTPLYEKHSSLGAKMVNFAGWAMPESYPGGIVNEHIHVREEVGLFDICHMGELLLRGRSARADLKKLFTANLDDLEVNKAKYGFFLNEKGCFIDDLIVFALEQEKFMLVVNSSRIEEDKAWIKSHLSSASVLEDVSERTGKIDIQGPLAQRVIERFIAPEKLAKLKRFQFIHTDIREVPVILSRTGYTGENGYEIFCDAKSASSVWDVLVSEEEVRPVGLGARDTLRLEMGYSLYGNDIDLEHTPKEAGLMKFVDMEKDLIGKASLSSEALRKMTGFRTSTRRSARKGYEVWFKDEKIGSVTSASYSPSLKEGIGLCYIDKKFLTYEGSLAARKGKKSFEIKLSKIPFLKK